MPIATGSTITCSIIKFIISISILSEEGYNQLNYRQTDSSLFPFEVIDYVDKLMQEKPDTTDEKTD